MGWGVSHYPHKEALADTITSTTLKSPIQTLPKQPKKETNFWFPFESSEQYSPLSTTSSSGRDRFDIKSPILSPFATPPLPPPTPSHEKKILPPTLAASTLGSSSCRYYPMADNKHDLFSSYANIVSEAASGRSSVLSFSSFTDGPSPSPFHHQQQQPQHQSYQTHQHQNQHQHSTNQIHQSQAHTSNRSSRSPGCSSGLFGSQFSSVSPYQSILQNMSYDVAAANGSARCMSALPSPTIFPPTPPPSAPWNPWSGF